ncbi:substrate-binding domain-containing protein [Iodobacter sp. LRB]|uniref:substrate-binding domain-containing protein n=1 Tax=unclassified Iodobacter TaxID=235634 RepID=UPI000C0C8091|nr:substrate-binding domain-containing protein [Iodobacter sp. BJB302]PHV00940.1 LacI family transcriptional regulator [Iodobacter sp. BJB302]
MNLRELALLLNLSPTTVSRALNGFSDVSEKTRLKVAAAAERHGYRPNSTARKLALGRTDCVGMIYPLQPNDLNDPVFHAIVGGMTDQFNDAGIDLMLISADNHNELQTYQRITAGHRVDGLIVARTCVFDERLRYLQSCQFPFVAHGRSQMDAPYPWFDYDNEAGTRAAVERLLALGHKRIALISAPLALNFAMQRKQGFVAAMQAAGVTVESSLLQEGALTAQMGEALMHRLLKLSQRPTAVIVDNNLAAMGVLAALRQAELRAGTDISLIVFGGVATELAMGQNITAIRQPDPREAGITLALLMLARLRGEDPASLQVLWPTLLQPGTSDQACLV